MKKIINTEEIKEIVDPKKILKQIKPDNIKKKIEPDIKDFVFFARELEVWKLAFGVTIGGAVLKLVTSIVTNLINPIVAVFMGKIDFNDFVLSIFGARILIAFISSFIDFTIVIIIVYIALKKLGLNKLAKKPEDL